MTADRVGIPGAAAPAAWYLSSMIDRAPHEGDPASVPVRVAFRNMPVSDDAEQLCWMHARRLARGGGLRDCFVVVSAPNGGPPASGFGVTVHLSTTGGALIVRRDPPAGRGDDLPRALGDAFRRAAARLDEHGAAG